MLRRFQRRRARRRLTVRPRVSRIVRAPLAQTPRVVSDLPSRGDAHVPRRSPRRLHESPKTPTRRRRPPTTTRRRLRLHRRRSLVTHASLTFHDTHPRARSTVHIFRSIDVRPFSRSTAADASREDSTARAVPASHARARVSRSRSRARASKILFSRASPRARDRSNEPPRERDAVDRARLKIQTRRRMGASPAKRAAEDVSPGVRTPTDVSPETSAGTPSGVEERGRRKRGRAAKTDGGTGTRGGVSLGAADEIRRRPASDARSRARRDRGR